MRRVSSLLVVFLFLSTSALHAQAQNRLSPTITASETEVCENDEVQLNLAITLPDNTSVQFDGASHQINFPSAPAFDFGANGDFTVEFQMKQNNPAGVPQTLVSKGNAPGAGFAVLVNGGFINVVLNDGTNNINFSGFTNVSDGAWHHVAVTFDRAGQATIYVDGAFDNDGAIAAVGNIDNMSPLVAGAAIVGGASTSFYGGFMDELRIWNSILTVPEIIAGSTQHLNPASFPNLIGYWDFNDITAPQVIDCSGTQATGTLVNGVALPPDAPALTWTFSAQWSTGQSNTNTIFVNPTDTTWYKVNIGYCKYFSVDSVQVFVVPCDEVDPSTLISSVWAPNAFTPNGDNKNDVFQVQASNIFSYEIMIFNRLGNIVYNSRDILSGWDGSLEGTALKDDVYTYVITYNGYDSEGEQKQFRKYGTVTIMR